MLRRRLPHTLRGLSGVSVRFSSSNKVIDVDDAVHLIRPRSTVTVGGFVSMGCPEEVLEALGRRFEHEGTPNDLTLVFQGGPGDWATRGLNHFAKPGMVKRTVGSHYGQVPMLGQLALDNKIEAYNLPMGSISRMMRGAACGHEFYTTTVGLGTMVDPKEQGGKINDVTTEDIVTETVVNGKRHLQYKCLPIDVAIIRGTYADEFGNLTMTREALYNDVLVQAMAARSRRGLVIAQVEHIAARGSLNPRDVIVPGTMVDCVVKTRNPANHTIGYFQGYDPTVTGEVTSPPSTGKPLPLDIRKVIARRGALELTQNNVVNLGIGMPEGVAEVVAEEGCLSNIELTTEPGIHGGTGLSGHNFGPARNYSSLLTMDHQFDFYNGGGLDVAFLGMAEVDAHGNVNVTRMGNKLTGPGGFIDISQSTQRVNILGSFTAGGLEVEIADGKLKIVKEGCVRKFVKKVREISFSGMFAQEKRQTVNYITERAVFNLTAAGVELAEIAPGVDLQKDILNLMDFKPIIREPLLTMDSAIFKAALMKLGSRNFGEGGDLSQRFHHAANTIYLDLSKMTINRLDEVHQLDKAISEYVAKHFPDTKPEMVVTYDSFDLHPELVQEYQSMQQRHKEIIGGWRRFSSSVFRRYKVGQAIGVNDHSAEEKAASIVDRIGDTVATPKDELLKFINDNGIACSSVTFNNLYSRFSKNAPAATKAEAHDIIVRLLH